ncbi:MAG: hypothetical protein ABIY70_04480 [Capsulimonas sp.]|uniref:hypothetical protein n=1 Tax=Capsulimonas sp. TaxID=2494211 RepID=UPI003265A4F3
MDIPIPLTPQQAAKRRKTRMQTAAVVGAIALLGGVFIHELDVTPNVLIPTPTLPSPNAYDDYARAAALMKDQREIKAPRPRGTLMAPETQLRVLRDNAPALAALRQGIAHSYLNPPARSFSTALANLEPDRALVRLLVLEADEQAARGDWGASAQTSLDGLKMGSDIPHGGGVIHRLVGIAIDAISREALGRAVDNLSLTETKAALERLRAIDADPQTTAQTFREAKWSTQASLMELFGRPSWRTTFLGENAGGDAGPSLSMRMSFLLTSKRRMMADYTDYMDTTISDMEAHRPISPLPPAHSDPMADILTPMFTGLPAMCDDDRTQNAFLEIALALHAYQLQHHDYPETLSALAPDLLPRLPDDPFAPGSPLRYQNNAGTYTLYSVGPDGVDDGGKAIDNPTAPSAKTRRSVMQGAKGDVVMGVNF